MKKLFAWMTVWGILFTFFFSAVAAELPQEKEILKRAFAVKQSLYPDADTVLVYEKERYTYDKSGCYRMEDESYTRILTEKGRVGVRMLQFHFNRQYSCFQAELVEIIKPDGRRIAVDLKKNSRISIDSSQMSSNIYDPAQVVLTIPVSGIEKGDLLHVKVSENTFKARIPGCWSLYTLLQADCPILENLVEINAPSELPLRSIAVKNPVSGTVKSEKSSSNGRIIYTWHASCVPQILPEPGAPELSSCVQRLLVSTAANWQEISRWYWNLCRPRLDAVTPEMKAKVAELLKGKKTQEEKLRAIFFFVAQQIRYMGITTEKEAPGYEPHDVKETFERRHGVCRDKAALLCAMLELAGIKAYPVLFMAGEPKDQEIPNIYFNHAVAAAELTKGQYTLLDPTYESSAELFPAIEQDMSYLVAHPQGEILRRSPVVEPERNSCRIDSKGKVDLQGVTVNMETTLRFTGNNDLYYRGALSRWPAELAGQFFAGRIKQAVPGAVLKKYEILPENIRDLSQPLVLKFHYSYPVNIPETDVCRLILPHFTSHFGLDEVIFSDVSLLKRKLPLKLFSSLLTEETFALELPPGIRILALPENVESQVGKKIQWQQKVIRNQNVVTGVRKFRLNALQITPDEYRKLLAAMHKAQQSGNSSVLVCSDFPAIKIADLQKTFQGANSVLEKLNTQIRLENAHNWRISEQSSRRILNYAGVKAHSEYKIVYNPAWESVSVRAAVITPDGKRRNIQPKEMNLMDSPRSQQVPRYPGEKILVLSLPGVIPGAVIEIEKEKVFRNHPFFQASIPFRSTNSPIIARCLEIDFPKNIMLHIKNTTGVEPEKNNLQQGRLNLKWSDRDLMRLVREQGQPDWRFFARRVMITNVTPAGLGAIYNKALMEKCGKSASYIQKILEEQGISKLPTRMEQIKAVRDYTEKQILLSGPGIADLPLDTLSDPEITLRNGSGNSADRAVVVGAMLKALKIDFDFIGSGNTSAISDNLRRQKESVLPETLLETILVYIPKEHLYLNDTGRFDQLGAVGHENKIGIELKSGRLLNIMPAPRCNTASRKEYKIICQRDGSAQIEITEEFSGKQYGILKKTLETATPERFRRFFESRAIAIAPEAQLMPDFKCLFTKNHGAVHYNLKVRHFTAFSGSLRTISLPGFEQFSRQIAAGVIRRATPFERKIAVDSRVIYRIQFPREWKLLSARKERSQWGSFNSSCYMENFNYDEGELRLSCKLALPVEWIMPYDYNRLENLQRVLSNPEQDSFLFRIKKENK